VSRPRLIVRPGEDGEQQVELSPGQYTIGRTQQNDVFVLHKSLSRQHARLTVDEAGDVTLHDLGSKNGTFVDGVRVDGAHLGRRHYLKCGDVVFSYINEEAPVSGRNDDPQMVVDPEHDLMRQPLETMLSSSGAASIHLLPATSRAQETLRVLLKVSEILGSSGDLDDVLVRTLELTFQLLDVDRASVLLGAPGELPVPKVARRRDGHPVGASPFSRRIVDYVLGRKVAALFGDVHSDVRIAAAGSIVKQSIAAAMCAPLLDRDREPIGAIYVDRLADEGSGGRRYGQSDLEFLSAFAHQVAIAADNAGLRKRLEAEALRRSTLQRFFPPTTIEALMKAGGELPVTETPATVVFCDISGYTGLCARRRPREVIEFLNAYFPAVVGAVVAHEGTLEKYIGDALLATWGAPIRREDDAARAVAAALDMQRAVTELNASFRETGRFEDIAVHIGVATGPVAAGNIGSSQYVQYATVGEVTTLASRICGEAGPGEVVIDEATRAAMGSAVPEVEALPPTTVRGHPRALTLYRLK